VEEMQVPFEIIPFHFPFNYHFSSSYGILFNYLQLLRVVVSAFSS